MPSKATPNRSKNSPQNFLISAADFQRMGEAGVFADKPRVELIDGNILALSPFTPYHNSHVDKASRFFHQALSGQVIVRTQGSVRLDDFSEPEPDIALLRFNEKFYSDRQVTPSDIFLLIEVAIHSLETDRTIKLDKYAQANIPEYWIVIPDQSIIEVYRQPEDSIYREKKIYRREDSWRFETFDLPVRGSDLLI